MGTVLDFEMELKVIKAALIGVLIVNIVGFCLLIHFENEKRAQANIIENTQAVELSEYPVIEFAPCMDGDNPDVTEEDWKNSGCLKMTGKTLQQMRGF